MTIHYKVSEKDYVNFNKNYLKNSKLNKLLNIFYILIPILFFLTYGLDVLRSTTSEEMITNIIASILAVLIFIIVMLVFNKLIFPFIIKLSLKGGKNDFIGKQTLTLYDDFMEDGNSQMTSRINYTSVEKICYEYDCFFIYLGTIKAIIIPVASFSDTTQRDEFITIMKQKTGLDVNSKKAKDNKLIV